MLQPLHIEIQLKKEKKPTKSNTTLERLGWLWREPHLIFSFQY